MQGASDEAIISLKTAAWLDEAAPLPHQYLANVYYLQGRLRAAIRHQRAALRRAPERAALPRQPARAARRRWRRGAAGASGDARCAIDAGRHAAYCTMIVKRVAAAPSQMRLQGSDRLRSDARCPRHGDQPARGRRLPAPRRARARHRARPRRHGPGHGRSADGRGQDAELRQAAHRGRVRPAGEQQAAAQPDHLDDDRDRQAARPAPHRPLRRGEREDRRAAAGDQPDAQGQGAVEHPVRRRRGRSTSSAGGRRGRPSACKGALVSDHTCYHFLFEEGAAGSADATGIVYPPDPRADAAADDQAARRPDAWRTSRRSCR